ncbi:hypothetical protein DVH24_020579 [Malus domestica]|uniref:Uncharacterized protein n=1 Tax=Malus domestica TaxID=3750 RepID=A0A498J8U0_MALDO|nr:hypothetical protein DVH24_020579 [Malus domestica]
MLSGLSVQRDRGREREDAKCRNRREKTKVLAIPWFARVSLRTPSEASNPRESPLVPFNLVPIQTKHGITV